MKHLNKVLVMGLFLLLSLVAFVFGQNWAPQTSGTVQQLKGLFMIDQNTGWACGDVGTLLHTTNGGASWNPVVLTAADLHAVAFKDAVTGIVVGDGGSIFRTTDGQNWSFVNSGTGSQLRAVSWGSGDVVWAAGRDGAVVRSTDAGATWSALNSGSTTRFRGVSAIGTDNAWVVGNDGVIRHTSNGGVSWVAQTSGVAGNLQDVQFLTDLVGFAAGSGSVVLYTNSGGATWTSRSTGIFIGLNGIYFLDENIGWAVGGAGAIFSTTNGGVNWLTQVSGTNQDLNEVHFVNQGTGWTVGNAGVILHFSSPTAIAGNGSALSDGFELAQNYPNPFNPSTMIEFSIRQRTRVSLKVFNIIGEEVATLLDNEMAAGQHRVVFNAGSLPSGPYFYQLSAEGKTAVRRLLLQK